MKDLIYQDVNSPHTALLIQCYPKQKLQEDSKIHMDIQNRGSKKYFENSKTHTTQLLTLL